MTVEWKPGSIPIRMGLGRKRMRQRAGWVLDADFGVVSAKADPQVIGGSLEDYGVDATVYTLVHRPTGFSMMKTLNIEDMTEMYHIVRSTERWSELKQPRAVSQKRWQDARDKISEQLRLKGYGTVLGSRNVMVKDGSIVGDRPTAQ